MTNGMKLFANLSLETVKLRIGVGIQRSDISTTLSSAIWSKRPDTHKHFRVKADQHHDLSVTISSLVVQIFSGTQVFVIYFCMLFV
jgi:hypothetical protein